MTNKPQAFVDLMAALNADLSYYVIEPSTFAVGEEGKYVEGEDGETVGYAIRNAITGVVEHTSLILPGVIWQAQHFDNTLKSLLQKDVVPESIKDAPVDDVILN